MNITGIHLNRESMRLLQILIDESDNIIASSNTVNFIVQYTGEALETIARSIDIEDKKKLAIEEVRLQDTERCALFFHLNVIALLL